eukprot:3328057-Pleurochrysis_carterae.AAC.2
MRLTGHVGDAAVNAKSTCESRGGRVGQRVGSSWIRAVTTCEQRETAAAPVRLEKGVLHDADVPVPRRVRVPRVSRIDAHERAPARVADCTQQCHRQPHRVGRIGGGAARHRPRVYVLYAQLQALEQQPHAALRLARTALHRHCRLQCQEGALAHDTRAAVTQQPRKERRAVERSYVRSVGFVAAERRKKSEQRGPDLLQWLRDGLDAQVLFQTT